MSFIDTSSGTPTYNPINVTYQQKGNWLGAEGLPWQTRSDFSGAESAFFNFWQQQQQNAYDLELWNLSNKYNSPSEQMKRYASAGLNPNLAYSQMPQTSPASSSNPIPAKPTNYKAQNILSGIQQGVQVMRGLTELMGVAKDMYSYARFGMNAENLRNSIMANQNDILSAQKTSEQAQSAALAWYYGNGIAYNSPFMLDKQVARDAQLAGTRLSRSNVDVNQQKIANMILDALKIDAETGRIKVDTELLNARIKNIESDTAIKNYLLRYQYPLMNEMREYQLNSLYPYQKLGLQTNFLNQWNYYQNTRMDNPFLNIKTGKAWMDDVLRHFGRFGLNFYENLPIFHPSDFVGSLGKYLIP